MFRELFPIVATSDLPRALGFYRDLLGGKVTYEYTGQDGAPLYVALKIWGAQLGLALAPGGPQPMQRAISLWLYVDDCDVAIEHLRRAGVRILEEPADQPWGERVARVADPDGNEVIVGASGAGSTAPD